MIPRRLIRTVPAGVTKEADDLWNVARVLHPTWDLVTFRDPIDPEPFPFTRDYWPMCKTGAQLAGLVRLEALWHLGGIYIDSDVRVVQALDPFLSDECFAAWEDENTVPDAVIGAAREHPVIMQCLDLALYRLATGSANDWRTGSGAWATGPGVTTTVLPFADGVTLYDPITFFPIHYSQKERLVDFVPTRETYGIHLWKGSWL